MTSPAAVAETAPSAHPWRSLAQASRVAPAGMTTPSPCVGVCKMNTSPAWCAGCHRSIEEIRSWSRMSDAEKRALWAVLEQRHALLHPPTARPVSASSTP